MKLDAITARVRMRPGVRATDFGVALARRWWTTYMPAWCLITIPFFVAAAALVYFAGVNPGIAVLGLWWLKPLFDRVVLFVLSRAFFGEEMDFSKTISLTIRSWMRWPALAQISVLRLIPLRSTLDPVLELEKPTMSRAWKRYSSLLGGFDVHGLLLGTIMEWVFVGAAWALVSLVVPQTVEYDSNFILEAIFDGVYAPGIGSLAILIYWLAVTAVEPFFVATGFASYINRRVELEGWDIELTFRRLAERMKSRASDALEKVATILLASFVGFGIFAASPDLVAQDAPEEAGQAGQAVPADLEEPRGYYDDQGNWVWYDNEEPDVEHEAVRAGDGPYDRDGNFIEFGRTNADGEWVDEPGYYDEKGDWVPVRGYFDEYGNFVETTVTARSVTPDGRYERTIEDPVAKVQEIVSNPEFGEKVTEEVWRLKESEPDDPSKPPDLGWLSVVAKVLQFIAYAVLALILGGLVYLIIKRFGGFERDAEVNEREATAIVLPGGERVELSDTWLEDVIPAWNRGERIFALSLLYRGTLADLKVEYGIKIPPSATARETVRSVRSAGGPHEFVRDVARLWTREVYAGRGPEDAEVERAVEAYRQLLSARRPA